MGFIWLTLPGHTQSLEEIHSRVVIRSLKQQSRRMLLGGLHSAHQPREWCHLQSAGPSYVNYELVNSFADMPIELPIKTTTQLCTSLIPGILSCAKWTGWHLMLTRTLISAICAVSEQNSEVRRCPTSAVCQGKAGSIWGCSQSGCICWRGSCTKEKPQALWSRRSFTLRVRYYPQKPGVCVWGGTGWKVSNLFTL